MTISRERQLEEALFRISEWVNAYPLDIFPEPDEAWFEKASWVLKEHGLALDRFAAHCMRHVITRVGAIAKTALAESSQG